MSFAEPAWLLLVAALLGGLALLERRIRFRQRVDLERLVSSHLLSTLTASLSLRRRRLKWWMLMSGVSLAGLAMAGPQVGFDWQETRRRGIDVLIGIDVSRSMLAQDVAPDRLRRAKLAINDLLEKLGSDRVGLIAFAGSAFLQCPLTLDQNAFRQALDVLEPGIIPKPGSDLAAALTVARDALVEESKSHKLLVLLSDGEDLGGGATDAAKKLAEDGVRVFTIGIGSASGELIPIPRPDGGTEFVKDPSGNLVKSKLDEGTLRQVAEVTGGIYSALGSRGEGIERVYEEALASIPKQDLASRMHQVPRNRFQWPLSIAIVLLAVELTISDRVRPARNSAKAAILALPWVLIPAATPTWASPQHAAQLYGEGKFAEALEEYRDAAKDDPGSFPLQYNLGATAYRAGQFSAASEAFGRAVASEDPELRERSFYNLGNAQFRIGQEVAGQDPNRAIQAWQQALAAYDSALAIDNKDPDTTHNRELVKKELEKLQQKKQQQEQNQGQDQNQDQDQKQEEQQGQEREQSQESQSKSEQNEKQEQNPAQDPNAPQDQTGSDEKQDQTQPSGSERADERTPDSQPKDQAGSPPSTSQPADEAKEPGERAQAPAGQMTAKEAQELLDSLRSEERQVPLHGVDPRNRRARVGGNVRDW